MGFSWYYISIKQSKQLLEIILEAEEAVKLIVWAYRKLKHVRSLWI